MPGKHTFIISEIFLHSYLKKVYSTKISEILLRTKFLILTCCVQVFPVSHLAKQGYKRGFDDVHNSERGNLFFSIADVLEAKRPKAYFWENVRGLISHNNGKTFQKIRQVIEQELGYSFYYQIVKASDYGLPQLRPRTFIVGFRDESFLKEFTFPARLPLKFNMSDV